MMRRMRKTIVYAFTGAMLLAASCKEQGRLQVLGEAKVDTYISDTIPEAQAKRILIEEMSGVDCVNCPAGAEELEKMSQENPGTIEIVTVHAGSLTTPFKESRQDLRMPLEKRNAYTKLLGDPSKPCAAFDRLPLGSNEVKYMVRNYNSWPNALSQAKTLHSSTPINIGIKTSYNSTGDYYDIEAKVVYNKALTAQNALHVFLTESDIMDIQNTPDDKRAEYRFNHVLRDALTPIDGLPFLTDLASKEAGRTLIYTTRLKIDRTDALQKNWKPENMNVVVFVSEFQTEDIHVYQVQSKKLVP